MRRRRHFTPQNVTRATGTKRAKADVCLGGHRGRLGSIAAVDRVRASGGAGGQGGQGGTGGGGGGGQSVTATIPVGTYPSEVAVSPTGPYAGDIYVTNYGSDTVSVINPATNTVVATIPLGFAPTGAARSTSQTLARPFRFRMVPMGISP